MKVIYVADNRPRPNFGCRATSAALSLLTAEKHEIVGRIMGTHTLTPAPGYNPLFPRLSRRENDKSTVGYFEFGLAAAIRRTLHKLGCDTDFVSTDLEKTIQKIKTFAARNLEYAEFDLDRIDFDALVINGEGTLIMTTPPRRDSILYLALVYWAKKRSKKVFFLNALISDCPKTGRNKKTVAIAKKILATCDLVSVRDPSSLCYAQEVLSLTNCKYIPDALFTWKKYVSEKLPATDLRYYMAQGNEDDKNLFGLDLTKGFICVSGSSLAAWNPRGAEQSYTDLVNGLKQVSPVPVILVQACDGDLFLKTVAEKTGTFFVAARLPIMLAMELLAHADLYISGRYHPSILASLGGTPCIFLGSNSHKTQSLQNVLEYPTVKEYNASPTAADITEICASVKEFFAKPIPGKRAIITAVAQKRANEAAHIMDFVR